MKRGGGACQIIDLDATHFMCPDPRSGCEDKEPPIGGLSNTVANHVAGD